MKSASELLNTLETRVIAATGCYATMSTSTGLRVYRDVREGEYHHLGFAPKSIVNQAEAGAYLEERAIAAVTALGWVRR